MAVTSSCGQMLKTLHQGEKKGMAVLGEDGVKQSAILPEVKTTHTHQTFHHCTPPEYYREYILFFISYTAYYLGNFELKGTHKIHIYIIIYI